MLTREEAAHAHSHFRKWYTHHARTWIERKAGILADRIGVSPHAVNIRDLGFRWGSCGQKGNVSFNWRCILLPPPIIEYVVALELAHLLEPVHSAEFWRRLERAMPDYAARKQWLAENGSRSADW